MRRRCFVAGLAVGAWAVHAEAAPGRAMAIYKAAGCACCEGWITHVRRAGFRPQVTAVEDLSVEWRKRGVPDDQGVVIELRQHIVDAIATVGAHRRSPPFGLPCYFPVLRGRRRKSRFWNGSRERQAKWTYEGRLVALGEPGARAFIRLTGGLLGANLARENPPALAREELVGVAGFEPATPASRTRCSTRLSHTPT